VVLIFHHDLQAFGPDLRPGKLGALGLKLLRSGKVVRKCGCRKSQPKDE
jgi:hypothetical protein